MAILPNVPALRVTAGAWPVTRSALVRMWDTTASLSAEEVAAEVAKDCQALVVLADRKWQRHNADDSLDARAFASLPPIHQGQFMQPAA